MRPALLALLCILPAACRTDGSAEAARADHALVPCTCGTAEADVVGCSHEGCLVGERNPDNPECVCGTLDIRQERTR